MTKVANPKCARTGCGHTADDHRLDDATNVSPVDPLAKFRCVVCACPDMVVPPDAGWPFNDAPEATGDTDAA